MKKQFLILLGGIAAAATAGAAAAAIIYENKKAKEENKKLNEAIADSFKDHFSDLKDNIEEINIKLPKNSEIADKFKAFAKSLKRDD